MFNKRKQMVGQQQEGLTTFDLYMLLLDSVNQNAPGTMDGERRVKLVDEELEALVKRGILDKNEEET